MLTISKVVKFATWTLKIIQLVIQLNPVDSYYENMDTNMINQGPST